MQRIPGNSHQPSINPNFWRLQPVASLAQLTLHNQVGVLTIINKPPTYHIVKQGLELVPKSDKIQYHDP